MANKVCALYVLKNWTPIFQRGFKNWDIRTYKTDYRGPIYIVESGTNKIISVMELVDCIPLTKELYDMHFNLHRITCAYEFLPYIQNGKKAYIWVLKNNIVLDDNIKIKRPDKNPYHIIDPVDLSKINSHKPEENNEQIIVKWLDGLALFFWRREDNYDAMVAFAEEINYGDFKIFPMNFVHGEVSEEDLEYIKCKLSIQKDVS